MPSLCRLQSSMLPVPLQGRQHTPQSFDDSLARRFFFFFYGVMEMMGTCVGGGSTWRHLYFILFLERELKSPRKVGKCREHHSGRLCFHPQFNDILMALSSIQGQRSSK